MRCIFFGHRECYGLDTTTLNEVLLDLLAKGVTQFYVGYQGQFDHIILHSLKTLRNKHSHISISVVLAYPPTNSLAPALSGVNTLYPEGLEYGPVKFAIERRNRWMIAHADYCITYVTHPRGGAYKFAKLAKKKGLTVINLGIAAL